MCVKFNCVNHVSLFGLFIHCRCCVFAGDWVTTSCSTSPIWSSPRWAISNDCKSTVRFVLWPDYKPINSEYVRNRQFLLTSVSQCPSVRLFFVFFDLNSRVSKGSICVYPSSLSATGFTHSFSGATVLVASSFLTDIDGARVALYVPWKYLFLLLVASACNTICISSLDTHLLIPLYSLVLLAPKRTLHVHTPIISTFSFEIFIWRQRSLFVDWGFIKIE